MFDSIVKDIKQQVRHGNNVTRLILINVFLFIFINTLYFLFTHLNAGQTHSLYYSIEEYLSLSSNIGEIGYRPWTILSHFFLHTDFWHILWNMLFLYWFGRIIGDFIGDEKVISLYILGGLFGAFFFCASANFLPYGAGGTHYAMGASAATMAIVAGAATLAPDYNMRLLFIGDVKIKYIAAVLILLDLFGTAGSWNTGGHFGHLGGAFAGVLYVYGRRSGVDLGLWVERLLDKLSILTLTPKQPAAPLKVVHKKETITTPSEEELNRVLEKIKKEGLGSLSDEERHFLDKMSKT